MIMLHARLRRLFSLPHSLGVDGKMLKLLCQELGSLRRVKIGAGTIACRPSARWFLCRHGDVMIHDSVYDFVRLCT